MYDDTIAAVATPLGEGGIAVIRVSGPGSASVAAAVFRPYSGGDVTRFSGYSVHYGVIINGAGSAASSGMSGYILEDVVDDALLTVFRAPRSYTGEDVCEIACHGGSATTRIVLDLVLQVGARVALPGEFTQRAFLNGRMDLAQAEAVADLVRARTESARRLARRQLDGDLSRAAAAIREELVGIVAAIEVTIDFSDEVGDLDYPAISARLEQTKIDLSQLLGSAGKGRVIRDGLNVAIVGRPNVGKSTLLNALLKSNRAIVAPIPGTTRDTIEESVSICGLPVVLTDTAGIRETDDAVERLGVERAKDVIVGSDIALLVLDAAAGITGDDLSAAHLTKEACNCDVVQSGSSRWIIVWNKRDLVDESALDLLVRDSASQLGLSGSRVLAVSAANRAGIELLEQALTAPYASSLENGDLSSADPIGSAVVSRVRHAQALQAAKSSLAHASKSADDRMPGDFIALDVRGALDALGQITGETVTEDIIHRIFKDFCVGK